MVKNQSALLFVLSILTSTSLESSPDDLTCFPLFTLAPACVPSCPSGYSSSSSTCFLEFETLLTSSFLPVYQSTLTALWKTSQNSSLPLTENRGIYLKSQLQVFSTQLFSFGGFLQLDLWIKAFSNGPLIKTPHLLIEKHQNFFSLTTDFLSFSKNTQKSVGFNKEWNAGWNFISLQLTQKTASDTVMQTQETHHHFSNTVFFHPETFIILGGFNGFIYKLDLYTYPTESEALQLPSCDLKEYFNGLSCSQCSNTHSPDCELFKKIPRKLVGCIYNYYNDIICLQTCPTGYSVQSPNCVLTASSYYSVIFHFPNSSYFQDSTGNITFAATYKLNAYMRGLYFNSTYGAVVGSPVQLSPDFELFLFVLPFNLTGTLLSKSSSPVFSMTFVSGTLDIELGSVNISVPSDYFQLNTWVGILLVSETIDASQATFSVAINANQAYSQSQTVFIDTLSEWVLSEDLSFNGFLYQLVYGPNYKSFSNTDVLTNSCNSTCNVCPTNGICLSTCAVNQYFDSSGSCNNCNSCDSCIRSTSCSLNVDPLCKDYNQYNVCGSCKDFATVNKAQTCQCVSNSNYQSFNETCCSNFCTQCGASVVYCENCASPSFQGVCLGACPTLTAAADRSISCVTNDADLKISFKFEVTGNYVKDTSLTPVSQKLYLFNSDGEFDALNPFIDDSDPSPGLGRGLYLNQQSMQFNNFIIAPIHTWLIWTQFTSFGSFLGKDNFYLTFNEASASVGYKAPVDSNLYTAFTNPMSLSVWNFIYLSVDIENNLTTVRFNTNQGAVQTYSPSPEVYVADFSGTLLLAASLFVGWIYRIEYYLYFVPNSQTGAQYQILSGLSSCGVKEYQDESGVCQSCAEGCETCLNGQSCFVCENVYCYSCYDYFTTDCLRCSQGQVFYQKTLACGSCLVECATCWLPQKNTCSSCSPNYFMSIEGICVQICPAGFTSLTNICSKTTTTPQVLSYKFTRISNPIFDSIQNIPLYLGSTPSYTPQSPTNPLFLTYRGLYFRSQSYASQVNTLGESSFLYFGNTHTVDLWVMPIGATQTCNLFSTWSKTAGTSFVELLVTPLNSGYTLNLNYYLESVFNQEGLTQAPIVSAQLSFNTWVRVSVKFVFSTSSVISLYVNAVLQSSLSVANVFLGEFLDTSLYFGVLNAYGSVIGYVYSYDLFVSSISFTDSKPCSCPQCTENGDCLIHCLSLEYWNGAQCTACNTNCTFGCTRAENCVLHPDDFCKYFEVLEPGTCEGCVDLAENTDKCGCVDNSGPLSDFSACVCNNGYTENNNQCSYCVLWARQVTSSYSPSFESIIFTFDIPIYNKSLSCGNIFTPKSLLTFGQGYSCSLTPNAQSLTLALGSGATFTYGEIDFQYKSLFSSNNTCSSTPSVLKASLQPSSTFPNTSVVLIYPEYVFYECDDLLVDGSNSLGAAMRPMLFQWTVYSDILSNLSVFSTGFQTESFLLIPRTSLFSCNVTITLTVQNAFGSKSTQSCTVESVIITDKMLVFYDKQISHYFLPDVDNYFDFFARKCNPVDEVQILWKILSITQNSSQVDTQSLWSAQKRNGQLVIPANTFVPGTKVSLESYVNDANSNLLAKAEISLVALDTIPEVFVDLSNGTLWNMQELVLNVSIFYEYDLSDYFELNWVCFSDKGDCEIAFQNESCVKIDAGELETGQVYLIELRYRDSQFASINGTFKSILLNTTDSYSPLVNIYEKFSGSQAQVLNIDSPAVLQCTVTPTLPNASYHWSLVSNTPLYLKEVTQSFLIINTQYLIPGSYYKLKLNLLTDSFTSEHFFEFSVNYPPIIENLQVSPKAGLELSTVFKLQAGNAYDPDDNYPLKYVFGYYQSDLQVMLNLKNQSLVFWTQLPYTGGTIKVFVIAYDSLGSAGETTSLAYTSYNRNLNSQNYYSEVKQKYSSVFFDLQTTSGLLALLSNGILNRQLLTNSAFSQASPAAQALLQESFDFCLQALNDMMTNIVHYDSQGVTAISKAILSISLNPNLETLTNLENLDSVIVKFLKQASSEQGIDELSFQNFVDASLNVAPLNSSLIFDNPQIFVGNVNVELAAIGEFLKQVPQSDTVYTSLTSAESVVKGVNGNTENFTVESEVYDSKVVFTGNLSQFLYDSKVFVSLLTISEKDESGFYLNSDETRPFVVDVSLFVNHSYTPVTTNKEFIKVYIPVYNINSSVTPQCAYLDVNLNEWKTDGCSLVEIINTTVVCSCSHLSSFSVLGFLETAGLVGKNTNIKTAFDLLLFRDIDSQNAAGVYFFSSIIIMYWLVAYFVHRIDLKQRNFMTTPLETDFALSTDRPAMNNSKNTPFHGSSNQPSLNNSEESQNSIPEEISPPHNSYISEECKESPSPKEVQENNLVLSEKIYFADELIPIKVKKTFLSGFVEKNSKSYKELMSEAHELFRIIYRPDMYETRMMLLTILYIKILLQVFLIGLFYKDKDANQKTLNYTSIKVGFLQYSASDFWIMVYSNAISWVVVMVPSFLLGYSEKHKHLFPFRFKNLPLSLKVRRVSGYFVSAGMILFCGISISLFSINFTEGTKNIWIVGTILSVFMEIFVVSIVKQVVVIFLKKAVVRFIVKKVEVDD